MKLFETSHKFVYPWYQVTTANWKKYPNDFSQHVISVDVISREIDPKTGILRTERLLCCKQTMPSWLCKAIGASEHAYFREISEIDPKTKTYQATSENLTFNNLIKVSETCTFLPDPVQPSTSTLFKQQASITTMPLISRFGKIIEETGVKRFQSNAALGRRGLEQVIENVVSEAERAVFEAKRFGEGVMHEASEVGAKVVRDIDRVVTDGIKEGSRVAEGVLNEWTVGPLLG